MTKFLIAVQSGPVEKAIMDNHKEIVRGRYVEVKDSPRPRCEWVDGVYEFEKTFNELCEQFPKAVIEEEKASPGWGAAWYKADENGNPVLAGESWDTSD